MIKYESQRKAMQEYWTKHICQYLLKLNNNTDMDLIKALAECQNHNGFIKHCMRYYLKHESVKKYLEEVQPIRKLPNSGSQMPPKDRTHLNGSLYDFEYEDVPGDPSYDPDKDPYFAEKPKSPYSLDKKYHI